MANLLDDLKLLGVLGKILSADAAEAILNGTEKLLCEIRAGTCIQRGTQRGT